MKNIIRLFHGLLASVQGLVPTLPLNPSRISETKFIGSLRAELSPDADAVEDAFEASLVDFESRELYGNTPKMWDLDQLANMLRKGKLNLSPKYQRGYVWKSDRASRLVVTALCSRLVPGIVLHEKQKGKFEVVDGKQRLMTLLSFYLAGEDPKLYEKMLDGQSSRISFHALSKLDENYECLDGLTYNHLSPDRQDALQSYTIPCTVIPYGTPKEQVFSCYEDINSGGEDLKAQQLRRAVYYGEYIEMLDKLAHDDNFQCIRDPKSFRKGTYRLCPKESDRELILRALAWARSYRSYKRPLKSFLNEELQHYENMNATQPERLQKDLRKLEDEFGFVMKIWRNVFSDSDGAFRAWAQKSSGQWAWSPSISTSLWDVQYSVLADLRLEFPTEPIYVQCKEELQAATKELFESGRLDISGPVTVTKFMHRRDVILSALRKVLRAERGARGADRRTFKDSPLLRESLYERQDGLCTICGGTIDGSRLHDGQYVHLDHRIPFSKGGSSTRNNAALTHAACNLSKGASLAMTASNDQTGQFVDSYRDEN